MQNTFGVQLRNDDIATVGLYHTQARQRLETTRQDAVLQTSAGALRAERDRVDDRGCARSPASAPTAIGFDVDAERSGEQRHEALPASSARRAALVLGPFRGTELYVNAGVGFHSNDARGATITRDPATGEPAEPVTPLVRANGAEVGVRTVAVPRLQTSVSLWSL